MLRRLLLAIADRLPCRVISEDGTPYLERYFVFHAFGVRCYLHRFVGSDPERGLHDHPWAWGLSVGLAGWYLEERRDRTRVRRWLTPLGPDTFHRVIKPHGSDDVWTLFLHSAGDVKPWGFLVRDAIGQGGTWEPYDYQGKAKNHRWEKTALRGWQVRTVDAAKANGEASA